MDLQKAPDLFMPLENDLGNAAVISASLSTGLGVQYMWNFAGYIVLDLLRKLT